MDKIIYKFLFLSNIKTQIFFYEIITNYLLKMKVNTKYKNTRLRYLEIYILIIIYNHSSV